MAIGRRQRRGGARYRAWPPPNVRSVNGASFSHFELQTQTQHLVDHLHARYGARLGASGRPLPYPYVNTRPPDIPTSAVYGDDDSFRRALQAFADWHSGVLGGEPIEGWNAQLDALGDWSVGEVVDFFAGSGGGSSHEEESPPRTVTRAGPFLLIALATVAGFALL